MSGRSPIPLLDRFNEKWIPEPNTGCFLWVGTMTTGGYGCFCVKKPGVKAHNYPAHRVSYELFVGPIPNGLTIDHLCRVRCCVNPAHLEAVSLGVNVLRGVGHGARHARQTHCKNGHPFDKANTRIYGGARQCAICILARSRAYKDKNRDRINANWRRCYRESGYYKKVENNG